MSDLYPEPPHLSAFVEPGVEPAQSLAACWEVLQEADCVFTGNALVAREQGWFHAVSDVKRDVIRHSGPPRDLLLTCDPLRIQFRHRSLGTGTLGMAPAVAFGERHPLEVAIHAGPLALPVELWSRRDRQAAKRILAWIERLLLALSRSTEALYGAIGIEAVFPTPGALAAAAERSAWRPTTWFWSNLVSDLAGSDEADLLACLSQAAVTRATAGTLFRAWRPGAHADVDEDGIDRVLRFLDHVVAMPR